MSDNFTIDDIGKIKIRIADALYQKYIEADTCPLCLNPKDQHKAKCELNLLAKIKKIVEDFNNEIQCAKCKRPAYTIVSSFLDIRVCGKCAGKEIEK